MGVMHAAGAKQEKLHQLDPKLLAVPSNPIGGGLPKAICKP
jgi:hypothetical protein